MTDAPIRPSFPARDVIILDGGLATELERRGNDLSDPLWSARLLIEAPGEIVAAHLAYFRAGARVATSASYQASFEGFGARGMDRLKATELIGRSVELAREARRQHRAESSPARDGREPSLFVAASVGPYGAVLADGSEYRGDYRLTVAELATWHAPRLAVLEDAGPDVLAIETIPSVDEGRALVELLARRPGPPAWLSFTCADGARTRHGEAVETAFALAEATDRIVAVGINCTAPEHAEELVRRARAETDKAIVVYPNSGETWDPRARRWTGRVGTDVGAASAGRWLEAGASLIGGCCRVGPERIAELAAIALG
ncbi:MAG: homocysteine S-methyltransferase [Chloroflexota bacterium]